MRAKLFVPIVILSLTLSIGLIMGKNCPALMCQCKWTNGKETAFCDNRRLNSIPIGIPLSTQVLNISDNKLRRLESQVFRERQLINLQKIFMSKCELVDVSDDSFVQLTNLIEIDLCDNLLESIPTHSLEKCKSLRKLWLCSNPIAVVRRDSFTNLKTLVNIDLSLCQINWIERNAFRGLNQLRYLKLNSNRLTTLMANALVDIRGLHSLDLHQNQWNCDCHLKDSIQWLFTNNVPQNIWPECQTPPHLKGFSWNELKSEELFCSPKFHSKSIEYKSKVGHNITIKCMASGWPLPAISWKFKNDSQNKIWPKDNQQKYWFSSETLNETFVVSRIKINGLTAGDSQELYCLASNRGGAYQQNFTLIVSQESKLNEITNQFELSLYAMILVISITFVISLVLISTLRSKRCRSVRLRRGSTKVKAIDILENCVNTDIQMKNILSNKPEIALISDIIRNTNTVKAYGFGWDEPTPDVTKYGPQYSTPISNSSVTLKTNVSTAAELPRLSDSSQTNHNTNNDSNHFSFEHFSADNRFKYKKLKSFKANNWETNSETQIQKPLVLSVERSGLNLISITAQKPRLKNIDEFQLKSNELESDKSLGESNLRTQDDNLSVTRV